MQKKLKHIYFSFPVQLVFLHFRSHLLLLFLWVLVTLLMSGSIGSSIGLQYLFLDPEYLGRVNFWSFYIVGLALGGLFMSWNLTTYLLSSQHFPFLASLSKPFTKFSVNNLVIPSTFFLFYLSLIAYFQYRFQELAVLNIAIHLLALMAGGFTTIISYTLYFNFTNRDINYYRKKRQKPPNLEIMPGRRNVDLDYIKQDENRIPVSTYLNERFQPKIVRSVAHYESRLLKNIFKQNHLNALAIQLSSMILLLLLGYLIDIPFFRIPAGASIIILLSIFVAFIGALTYWFGEWRAFVIIAILAMMNYLTSFDLFKHQNHAYGLDYQSTPATYSYDNLENTCYSEQVDIDRQNTLAILNRWKTKASNNSTQKPKMVLVCASGGGLKAAVWSMHTLQTVDSILDGQLFKQTVLMTGASGGMLGTAYLRELYYQNQSGEKINYHAPYYRDCIAKDLLNSVAFTIVSNDLFMPWNSFQYGGQRYFKDRGYIFEQQLNENTEGLLDKPIAAYRDAELTAKIPMLLLSPSIVNDGRQFLISPQGLSYMMMAPAGLQRKGRFEVDAVDFGHFFTNHHADSLRFLTALRMNATYPYVLPNVHLPTEPAIEVVDAGFRDNYGILSATRFIQVFQNWIKANTSGVVLLQISGSEKIEKITPSGNKGMIEDLFNPLGIAGKILDVQEYGHDASLGFIYDILPAGEFEVIRFLYHPADKSKLEATVSFHITEREVEDVISAFALPENQAGLERLKNLLSPH